MELFRVDALVSFLICKVLVNFPLNSIFPSIHSPLGFNWAPLSSPNGSDPLELC